MKVMRSRCAVWFCAALVGMAAVACSGDDDDSADKKDDTSSEKTTTTESSSSGGNASGTEAEYIDAITEAGEDPDSTPEQNRCVAEAFVDTLGVEGFVAAGVSPDDIRNDPDSTPKSLGITFTDAQKDTLWDAINECRDIPEFIVEQISKDGQYTAEQTACLKDGLSEDLVKGLFLPALLEGDDYDPDPAVTSQLAALMGQCGMAG